MTAQPPQPPQQPSGGWSPQGVPPQGVPPQQPPGGWSPQGVPSQDAARDARVKVAELVDGEWHRLHPATPLLRGGLTLIVFLGLLISIFRDRFIALFVPDEFEEYGDDVVSDFIVEQLLWVTLGVIGLVLLLIVMFWVGWRVHRFRITGDAVEVQQGILFRQLRRAPLARIQGININKPWFARLLGACKFEVQQAGSDSNVDLNYLSSSVADALRFEIMNRASGRSTDDAARLAANRQRPGPGGIVDDFLRPDAEVAHLAPNSLVRIPVSRIVLSSLLDGWIVAGVVAILGSAVLVLLFQQWWVIFAFLPGALALFFAGVKALGSKLRYSIAATPDGIRLAHGLLSSTTDILPPGRIFAMQIKQPLLWRPFGWWQVTFTRAGNVSTDVSSSGGQSQSSANYLLPVGDMRDVRTAIGLVAPELAQSPLIDQGMHGQAPDAFVVSPARARIFRWFSVRRNGFHVHPAAFLLRHGRVWRSLHIVPAARVQSVSVQQGPIYGLAKLARMQFHVPGGVFSPSIGAIGQHDATLLFDHASRTIKSAIATDASESWAAALTRHAVIPAPFDGRSSDGRPPFDGRAPQHAQHPARVETTPPPQPPTTPL